MNIWTITWRWSDGSGSGIVPFGFTDNIVAELAVQVLQQEGSKVYELADMTLVDTLGYCPNPWPGLVRRRYMLAARCRITGWRVRHHLIQIF
jgi:hypothetical protein